MRTFTLQLLLGLLAILGTVEVSGQCTEYSAPSNSNGYSDFNSFFGGAPCDDGNGSPIEEITSFEVFASEAYQVQNFIAGGSYEFSICNGPNAGSWVPEFTIIAPSGAIDTFGIGEDSCRISWVASESGIYQILINELGQCGGGPNTGSSNGYPGLRSLGNAVCPEVCTFWLEPEQGVGYLGFNSEFGGAPIDDGSGCPTYQITAYQVWAAEAYAMENVVQDSNYVFSICDGPGAGAWIPEFTIIAPSGAIDAFGIGVDSCWITWKASESGEYLIVINEEGECGGGPNRETNNGFPTITLGSEYCEFVTPMDTCMVGTIVSDTNVLLCGDQDSVFISVEGSSVPDGGGFAYGFAPGDDGAGGRLSGFSITSASPTTSFESGIGGLLAENDLDNLSGTWFITPFVYTEAGNAAGSSCEISDSSITVYFNPDLSIEVEDQGAGSAAAIVTGGTAPYTYLWSDANAQTTDSVSGLVEGDFTISVTDAVGCSTIGMVTIMISSTENIKPLSNIRIAPNPTAGIFTIHINSLNVDNSGSSDAVIRIVDVAGRQIASERISPHAQRVEFDLRNHSDGLYIMHLKVGSESTFKKILLTR